jgi:hypothetical protein
MNYTVIQQAVDAAMSETLTSAGFQHTSLGTWNRRRGYELNVIQLQKQSAAELFCVNLGVHYGFMPKTGTGAAVEGDLIELSDCELKLRLTEQPTDRDQWWPISETSVKQVADCVRRRGLVVFDTYRTQGELATMDARNIEAGNSGILTPITKVRACLLLARLHEHLGNRDKCIEAASIGVKLAGMAVGPKKALKEVLRRCENRKRSVS